MQQKRQKFLQIYSPLSQYLYASAIFSILYDLIYFLKISGKIFSKMNILSAIRILLNNQITNQIQIRKQRSVKLILQMFQINKRKSISEPTKPNRVNFFYIKPLQQQQQEICDPGIQADKQKQQVRSIMSYCQSQYLSFNSSNNKSNFQTRSDNNTIQSSSIQLQKIKRKYLNDYLFLSNLGKGAYGRVQKLRKKQDGVIYAGKILLKSYNTSTNKYKNQKLQSQIKIYQKISHSNIPQLHQIYTWKNEYTLIMEFAKGKNLHTILQDHPNDQQKIARVMFQILDTLQYLHSLNIVHHDIKPQNIVYDPETQIVKIVDYGEAIQLSQQVQYIEKQGGTYAYFSPQHFQNQCSTKIDIWAAGVIFYYLLDNKIYFHESSRQKMKRKILSKQVKFQGYNWSNRSQLVKDLIIKMLEKNPTKRIAATQAKNNSWIQLYCKDWRNPSKNILSKSIRNQKRSASFQKYPENNQNQQRKLSCDLTNLGKFISNKKLSRFCNNKIQD